MFHVSFTRDILYLVFKGMPVDFLTFVLVIVVLDIETMASLIPSDNESEFEGFSQEELRSVTGRIDLLSEDGSDIGISQVSTPEISDDQSDDKPFESVWSSNLRRFEVNGCFFFFLSPKLFEDFFKDDIYCCGTVRCNRKGLPESLRKPKEVTKQGHMKVCKKTP